MSLEIILENKRDEYMINVLEESTSELESLKTKKYLTENLNMIGKILVEEGVVDAAKANLANNWGKYAAGAGVIGAGVAGYEGYTHPEAIQQAKTAVEHGITDAKTAVGNGITDAKTAVGNGITDVKTAVGNGITDVKDKYKNYMAPAPTITPEEAERMQRLSNQADTNNTNAITPEMAERMQRLLNLRHQ